MPRTGTRTLCDALTILGYKTVHNPRDLPLFPDPLESFRAYAVTDAIADGPAILYWAELAAYYQCKVILTVRNVDTWWESIKRHTNTIRTGEQMEHIAYADAFHGLLFGTPQPCRYWWQRRFEEHNERVKAMIAADSLLVMDIVGGDKWETLCPFLGKPQSKEEWPWRNKAT